MRSYVLHGRQLLAALAAAAAVGMFVWMQGQAAVCPAAASPRRVPIYSVNTPQQAVALGINCAWGEEDIPQLLDALDEAGVKATFFLLGQWCERYPEAVRLIAQHGHEIASHGYCHDDMTGMTREQLTEQIERGMDVLEGLCGTRPRLIRPPSGAYDDLAIDTIEALGYVPIQWSVDSLDWKDLSAEQIVRRVVSRCESGSIVLLHSGAQNTAQALPQLLEGLVEKGLSPIPVGRLIYWDGYTLDAAGCQQPLPQNPQESA